MASAISVRVEIFLVGGILAMTALIAVAMTASSSLLVGITTVLLLPAVALIARFVFALFDEHEHLDPETAAMLSEEGVGDPDRGGLATGQDHDRLRGPGGDSYEPLDRALGRAPA